MADSCKVGPDYPSFVERGGRRYEVSVDTDSDGTIRYFQLLDVLTEELFFEIDYEADSLSEYEIWQAVGFAEDGEIEEQPALVTSEVEEDLEAAGRRYFSSILDERYPLYADLGDEFREEAIDVLKNNRYESVAFQEILLDELADNYEDRSQSEPEASQPTQPVEELKRSMSWEIAKNFARRDRESKSALVARRRAVGLTQSAVDEALGSAPGFTKKLEAYDSDPRVSELRRYEAYIMLAEIDSRYQASLNSKIED